MKIINDQVVQELTKVATQEDIQSVRAQLHKELEVQYNKHQIIESKLKEFDTEIKLINTKLLLICVWQLVLTILTIVGIYYD